MNRYALILTLISNDNGISRHSSMLVIEFNTQLMCELARETWLNSIGMGSQVVKSAICVDIGPKDFISGGVKYL